MGFRPTLENNVLRGRFPRRTLLLRNVVDLSSLRGLGTRRLDREVDQLHDLVGERRVGQGKAVDLAHPRGHGDAGDEPNTFRRNEIRRSQRRVLAAEPLAGRDLEERLLRGAGQDSVLRRRRGASFSRAMTTVERGPSNTLPSLLTKITSSAPNVAAYRSAAMFVAYDKVFAPSSCHGALADRSTEYPRASVSTDTPSRRASRIRSDTGPTVTKSGRGRHRTRGRG